MPNFDIAAALESLGDPQRREIYERLLIQPRRLDALDAGAITRATLSYHVRNLRSVGLIESKGGLWIACPEPLGLLRAYFDRLWFEATVGEAWLLERFAVSRQGHWRGMTIGGEGSDDLDAA